MWLVDCVFLPPGRWVASHSFAPESVSCGWTWNGPHLARGGMRLWEPPIGAKLGQNKPQQHSSCAPILFSNGGLPTSSFAPLLQWECYHNGPLPFHICWRHLRPHTTGPRNLVDAKMASCGSCWAIAHSFNRGAEPQSGHCCGIIKCVNALFGRDSHNTDQISVWLIPNCRNTLCKVGQRTKCPAPQRWEHGFRNGLNVDTLK